MKVRHIHKVSAMICEQISVATQARACVIQCVQEENFETDCEAPCSRSKSMAHIIQFKHSEERERSPQRSCQRERLPQSREEEVKQERRQHPQTDP